MKKKQVNHKFRSRQLNFKLHLFILKARLSWQAVFMVFERFWTSCSWVWIMLWINLLILCVILCIKFFYINAG